MGLGLLLAGIHPTLAGVILGELAGEPDEAASAREHAIRMADVVLEHGWDGEWFLRAYDFFGDKVGSLLRALGSGSRFSSVERGVIDLRDLVYFALVIVLWLLANTIVIELKKAD